jgi:hypothetical protein
MALKDVFSDKNEGTAKNRLTKGLREGQKVATKALRKGEKGFKGSYAQALGDVAGSARTATNQITASEAPALNDIATSTQGGINYLTGGEVTGRADITGATDKAVGAIRGGETEALKYYDPYAATGTAANTSYANALGLNGAAGREQAVNDFRVTPGYEFALNQGLQELDRRAASRGMLGSGNTSIDTLDYAHGLSDQEYGDYLDRLLGQQQMGVNVAGSQAGIRTGAAGDVANLEAGEGTGLADLATRAAEGRSALTAAGGVNSAGIRTNAGTARAGIATDAGTRAAAINTDLGGQKYSYASDLADLRYRTKTGIAGAEAGYQQGKDATGANIVGGVTGGLSLGAKLLGLGGGTSYSSQLR